MTIANGTEVLFRNVDAAAHTVTVVATAANDTWLGDAAVRAGETHAQRFEAAGSFVVFCRYHGDAASGQRMTVVVT